MSFELQTTSDQTMVLRINILSKNKYIENMQDFEKKRMQKPLFTHKHEPSMLRNHYFVQVVNYIVM